MFFYLTAFLIAAVDQLLKYLVHQHMLLGHSLPLLDNVVKLTYVQNTGAAFSFFVGFSSYLAVVGVIISAVVIYFHYRMPAKSYFVQLALAFILGGSVGNLVDRVFRFYVIDYIDITVWPVFNFADIMINAGVVMLLLKFMAKEGNDVSNPVQDRPA